MAGVPQNFVAFSNVLANYNFVDLASGTGYINFYAGKTVDLSLLSNFTYYSDVIYTEGNNGTAAYVLLMDIDFDVLLNRPLDIKGMGILNIPLEIVVDAGTGKVSSLYATAILRKWDGSTETDIVSNDSSVLNATGIAGTVVTRFAVKAVDLTAPLTHFKVGETLRVTVRLYGKTSDGTGIMYGRLAHDPKNRSDGWDGTGAVPSQLAFQCPVRLNL